MMNLDDLKKEAEVCRKCDLWKKRNKLVFGEGPSNSKIMMIGLGPGYHENLQGRPFVGAAGKLLDKLMAITGVDRSKVYITNVIKCYLPDNKPKENEIKACGYYLDRQIDIINPKLIITLGNISTEYVFNKFGIQLKPMKFIHSNVFNVSNLQYNLKVIPMYHPAAALRNPPLLDVLKNDWENIKPIITKYI